jgi:predicted nucleotidyltransferase
VTSRSVDLTLPPTLSTERREVLLDVASRNDAEHGADLVGLVLSGSVGRGVATDRSDVDVYVVLTDDGITGRDTTRSTAVDEIPVALSELEDVPPFGSDGWWYRWSFAWAPVLLDRTDGRLRESLRRQATVTVVEAEEILVAHDRLDGWINYAYRALKNDRDGRALERRLDAAESIPWLLDTVFTLAGRVRPYHKYLPWELREHPLADWEPDELLGLLDATLDGDPSAIRATFTRIEDACAAFDRSLPEPALVPVIAGWSDELALFRG